MRVVVVAVWRRAAMEQAARDRTQYEANVIQTMYGLGQYLQNARLKQQKFCLSILSYSATSHHYITEEQFTLKPYLRLLGMKVLVITPSEL